MMAFPRRMPRAAVRAFDTFGVDVERKAQLSTSASYDHDSGFTLSADAFGEVDDISVFGARIELSREF